MNEMNKPTVTMISWLVRPFRSREAALATILLAVAAIGYLVSMKGYDAPLMIPDEFGYLTVAAYLAGHDWSAVTQGMPWYSFGYSLLLAPLFSIVEPSYWYRAAQLLNIGLVACTVTLMVAVLRRTGPETQSKTTPWLAAGIVVLYPSVFFYAKLAATETLIFVTPWLAALLLARAIRGNVRWIDAVLLGAATVAMYFIHSRLLGTMAAIVACAGLFALLSGRLLPLVGGFALGAVPVALAGKLLKGYLIDHVYQGQLYGAQHSLSSSIEFHLGKLASWDGLGTLFGVFSGHLTYVVVSSLGVAVIGIVWTAKRVYQGRRSLAEIRTVLPLFFLLNLAFTFAISVVFLGVPNLPHHVFYGRYIEPALMPMVALGVAALLEGEGRWRWAWGAGVLTFLLLAPVAMKLVATLPAADTYWILIVGLFPFRTSAWMLDPTLLALGFSGALLLLTLCWRWGRLAGVSAIAVLFSLASLEVVRTFAFAAESRRYQYTAYQDVVATGEVKLGYLVQSDPTFLRSDVQVHNPRTQVIPLSQWRPTESAAPMELIEPNGGNVSHRWCGSMVPSSCTPLTTSPLKEEVRIGWPGSPTALGAVAPSSARLLLQKLSVWPFLRSLNINPTDVQQQVVLLTDAKRQGSYTLVTFITSQDQPEKWLGDRHKIVSVPAGQSKVKVTTSIPLRGYDGTPLAPGRYSAHWVVTHPDGYDWSTHMALPLSVE